MLEIFAGVATLAGVLLVAGLVQIGLTLRWFGQRTLDGRYFRLPLAERRAVKAEANRRGRRIAPALWLVGQIARRFRPPSGGSRGVTGPIGNCTAKTFERAFAYRPDARDVFVATQMKCGTTWMQQIVYEVLSKGRGDLSDDGHRHIQAVCPWLEARIPVPLEEAPRIGERQQRIIKTHMPASVTPYSEDARYICVTRHPVACFASTVDFLQALAGPLASDLPVLLDWYLSDRMWWRSWPEHVDSWWRQAEKRPNVIFLHYEDMKDDLAGAVDRVADFLGVRLADDERAHVVHKSSYDYMKQHEEVYEMTTPTPFAAASSFFKSGRKDRHLDVDEASRARILAFCRERLADSPYPVGRFYPDVLA